MRGLLWLCGAGAMIGAGGWLMTQGDAGAAMHERNAAETLAFPTHQQASERAREAARSTLPSRGTAAPGAPPGPAHDPMLVAFPPDASTALVFEAGTILRAPVGQAMLACIGKDERARMDESVADLGKSWFDLADRVGIAELPGGGGLFLLQGKLGDLEVGKLAPGAVSRPHGAGMTVYDVDAPAGEGRAAFHAAVWEGSLLVASRAAGAVEAALDRLSSGSDKLAFDEAEAYGEAYGIVGQEDLERLVPADLKDRVHEVAAHGVVHVDAIDEVLMVLDVEGSEPKAVEDLGKSLGAALALGRLEAKREGQDDLVRLMDQSRVRPFGGRRLRAEVAIPTDVMTRSMHGCGRDAR